MASNDMRGGMQVWGPVHLTGVYMVGRRVEYVHVSCWDGVESYPVWEAVTLTPPVLPEPRLIFPFSPEPLGEATEEEGSDVCADCERSYGPQWRGFCRCDRG